MTLESALPWISLAAAAGAGLAAAESGRVASWLKAVALGTLAVYAYFRWITPSAAPMGLVLQAIAYAVAAPGGPIRRDLAHGLSAVGWLVLADLYLNTGDGPGVFVGDGFKAALLAALLIGGGYGMRRLWSKLPARRLGLAAEAGAVAVMAVTALTLDWGFWPVILGAAGVVVSRALLLYVQAGLRLAATAGVRRGLWALDFLGQAVMAYAFLR